MENGDISSIISKIVSDPEFAGMVNELRGQNGSPAVSEEEILSKLPEVMKTVAPLIGNADEKSGSDGGKPDKKPKSGEKYDKKRAERLMHALKPYLSRDRGEIIDKCVSVMELSDIVGSLGGIGGIEKLLNKEQEDG